MRILRTLLATGASLAAFTALRAESNFGRQWLAHYYQNPRPDELVAAVYSLDRDGYFDSAAQRDTAVGFFTTVFRQQPAAVDGWLRTAARILPESPRRVLAAAAWFAGNATGARQVRALGAQDDNAAEIARLAAGGAPAPVADLAVNSEPAMNLQWGAFLASGDRRYVSNVFAALGSNQSGLASSAGYVLAQNAAADPRVMEICQTELSRQPAAVRASFEAALNEAAGRKPGA